MNIPPEALELELGVSYGLPRRGLPASPSFRR